MEKYNSEKSTPESSVSKIWESQLQLNAIKIFRDGLEQRISKHYKLINKSRICKSMNFNKAMKVAATSTCTLRVSSHPHVMSNQPAALTKSHRRI